MQKVPSYFHDIGINEIRNFIGGKGHNFNIVVVETATEPFYHRDLNDNMIVIRKGPDSSEYSRRHITAVTGIIGADDNSMGYVGVAPDSMIFYYGLDTTSKEAFQGFASDIVMNTNIGDIVAFGFSTNLQTPIEWAPDFTKEIQYLVDNGRVVIELAGNGSKDLDATVDEEYRIDTGAIVVANATFSGGTWKPAVSSTYGSRINISAPGTLLEVTYDQNQFISGLAETNSEHIDLTHTVFSGTSAAYPVVAGICAILQSLNYEWNNTILDSVGMRECLINGTNELDFKYLPDRTGKYGAGIINVLNSARYLSSFSLFDFDNNDIITFKDFIQFIKRYAKGEFVFKDFVYFRKIFGFSWPKDFYDIE